MVTTEQAYYSRGFKKSVSDTHAWRTVENSAKYLIPVIKPDFKVLDVEVVLVQLLLILLKLLTSRLNYWC